MTIFKGQGDIHCSTFDFFDDVVVAVVVFVAVL